MVTVVTKLNANENIKQPATKPALNTKNIPEATKNKDTLHIVNIGNKNISEKDKPQPGDELWYNSLRSWVIFGAIASSFFVLLAFYDLLFLLLIPIGPILGWVAWQIRKLARKYNPYKEDILK